MTMDDEPSASGVAFVFILVELDKYDDDDTEDRALLLQIYGVILDDLTDPTVVRVEPDKIADRFLAGS